MRKDTNLLYKLRKKKNLVSVGFALAGIMIGGTYNPSLQAEAQTLTVAEVQNLGLPSELTTEITALIEAGEEVTVEMVEQLLAQLEGEEISEDLSSQPQTQDSKKTNTVISEPYIKINGEKNESKEVNHLDKLKTLDNASISFDVKPDSLVGRFTLYTATGPDGYEFFTIYVTEGMVKVEGRDRKGNFYNLDQSTAVLEEDKWNNIIFSHSKTGENILYVNGEVAFKGVTPRGGNFIKSIPSVNTTRFGAMMLNGKLAQGGATYEVKNFKVIDSPTSLSEAQEIAKFTTPSNSDYKKEYIAKSSVFGNSAQEGFYGYRAPYTFKTQNGTLLSAASKHIRHHIDWGDLNLGIARSEDNGKTWSDTTEVIDLAENPSGTGIASSAFTIDSAMVQDSKTGKLIVLTDVFRESQGLFDSFKDTRPQYTGNFLNLYIDDTSREAYTVRENGVVFDPAGKQTEYTVVTPELSKDAKKSDIGNIIKDGKIVGNYLFTKNTPFRVVNRIYTWQIESTDDGKTWSNPKDITKDLLAERGISDLLISPTAGIQLKSGRLIIPVYYNSEKYRAGIFTASSIYSDDQGGTWKLSKANDEFSRNGSTENSIVELNNGTLLMAARNNTGKTLFYKSTDQGETWQKDPISIPEIPAFRVQPSIVQLEKDGKEYLVIQTANGPKRMNGTLYLLEINEDNLTFVKSKLFEPSNFGYGSLTKLNGNEFLSTYEHAPAGYSQFSIARQHLSLDWILSEEKVEENSIISAKIVADKLLVEYKYPVTTIKDPVIEIDGVKTTFSKQISKNILEFSFENTNNKFKSAITSSANIESVNGQPINSLGEVVFADYKKGSSIELPELKEGVVNIKEKPKQTLMIEEKPAANIGVSLLPGQTIPTVEEKPEIKIETTKGSGVTQPSKPSISIETSKGEGLRLDELPKIAIEQFKLNENLFASEKPVINIETLKGDSVTEEKIVVNKVADPLTVEWEGVFTDSELIEKAAAVINQKGVEFKIVERPSTSKPGEYIAKLEGVKDNVTFVVEVPVNVKDKLEEPTPSTQTSNENEVETKDNIMKENYKPTETTQESQENVATSEIYGGQEITLEQNVPNIESKDVKNIATPTSNEETKELPKSNSGSTSGVIMSIFAVLSAVMFRFLKRKEK